MNDRHWDAVIVGAGHNGLTAAAYLARAGRSVLVLERRDQVGGACTLEEPWPGYAISPCAYLAGLLHPLVVEELAAAPPRLRADPAAARGPRTSPSRARTAARSRSGSTRTARSRSSAPADGRGYREYVGAHRAASATRCAPTARTTCGWPSRRRATQIEARLGGDEVAIATRVRGRLHDDARALLLAARGRRARRPGGHRDERIAIRSGEPPAIGVPPLLGAA